MSGKYALIIGNTEYTDSDFAQLKAPGKDAKQFWRVLASPDVAAFDDVMLLLNAQATEVNKKIEIFFGNKNPEDLLLLYFSGHGVRDASGKLYLAVKDTHRKLLLSTAVSASFIRQVMEESRSKRQVLILDCCNSGAFPQGTKAATGGSIGTASAFGAGYGHIILTATDSTQYAWEGDKVISEEVGNSLFTHFLINGLKGEADVNGDGQITVDELFDYASEQVRRATSKQTPQTPSKFSSKEQGEIILREGLPSRVQAIQLSQENSVELNQLREEKARLEKAQRDAEKQIKKAVEEQRKASEKIKSLTTENERLESLKAEKARLEKTQREAEEQIKNLIAEKDKINAKEDKINQTPSTYIPRQSTSTHAFNNLPLSRISSTTARPQAKTALSTTRGAGGENSDTLFPTRTGLSNRYSSLYGFSAKQDLYNFKPLESPAWWVISLIKFPLTVIAMFLANFVVVTYIFPRFNLDLPKLGFPTLAIAGGIWGLLYILKGTNYSRSLFDSTIKFLEVAGSYIFDIEDFFAIVWGILFRFQISFVLSICLAAMVVLLLIAYFQLDPLSTFFWAFVVISIIQMWYFMEGL